MNVVRIGLVIELSTLSRFDNTMDNAPKRMEPSTNCDWSSSGYDFGVGLADVGDATVDG